MFAFSLGFQMTSRFLPEYMVALGASGFVVGLFGTFGNVISAVYPYPGGAISDRIGSRYALTAFGLVSTVGFVVWLIAPNVGAVTVAGVTIEPWIWIFVGLVLAQAWKSFGLGATFAVVKQATDPSPAGGRVREHGDVPTHRAPDRSRPRGDSHRPPSGVHRELSVRARGGGRLRRRRDARATRPVRRERGDAVGGGRFEGVSRIRTDLREMPDPLRPLLIGDTLVRFANGMVYVFFVLVVTRIFSVGERTVAVGGISYAVDPRRRPFSATCWLGVEMVVALITMVPAAKLAERVGLLPIVALGFFVYGVFPLVLVFGPDLLSPFVSIQWALVRRLRVLRAPVRRPSHKALIVGPAEQGAPAAGSPGPTTCCETRSSSRAPRSAATSGTSSVRRSPSPSPP